MTESMPLDASTGSPMKIDGFLKVPDIPGPSERDGHEDEIEVHGVKFNMEAPHDPNSLSRRGRVALDMIVFTKYYDMASPYLKKALFENTPLGRGHVLGAAHHRGRDQRLSGRDAHRRLGDELRDAPARGRARPDRGEGRLRLPQDQVRLRQGPRDRDETSGSACEPARPERMRWPSRPAASRATREAVQPSLWDRLVNDLPGVASEIDGLRDALDRGARRRAAGGAARRRARAASRPIPRSAGRQKERLRG